MLDAMTRGTKIPVMVSALPLFHIAMFAADIVFLMIITRSIDHVEIFEDHEWARLEGDVCIVGISPHAVEQLGDIVFIELPEAGANVAKARRLPFLSRSKPPGHLHACQWRDHRG